MATHRLKVLARLLGLSQTTVESTPSPGVVEAPIETAAQDRLRRMPFVERVAEVLSEPAPAAGRVFAIRGDWGSGKSSFKNLVAERLSAFPTPPLLLQFNPWQWRDADAIARALYLEIADRLGGGWTRRAALRASRLRRYGAIVTGAATSAGSLRDGGSLAVVVGSGAVLALAASVGLALPSAAAVGAVLALAAILLTGGGRVLAALGRDRSNEPLDDVRRDLEASLRTLERPLIVFVDDIDRLEPDEIREVMRQVKANGALPNIVFVLLFQPSIVEAALDPISNGEGRNFLEKIVQTSFDLPATPASAVQAIMTEELSSIAGRLATSENGFETVRWGNVLIGCIQPRIRSLRDARRYLSSVMAHLPLQEDSALEVNVIDFLALEALRVFEPTLHGRLFFERELLLQTLRFRQDGRDAEQRTRVEQLVGATNESMRAVTIDTLKELFPTIEWAFGGTHYSDGFHQRWAASKRVCTPRYFPRYFELQTAAGEMSESEFNALIAHVGDPDQLSAALASLEDRGLLPSLAARFDESVDRLPPASAEVLLPAMFSLGQKLVATGSTGAFDSPWTSAWRAVSWYLRSIPAEDRGRLALEALRRTGALSVAAILIHLNDPADRQDDERADFVPDLSAEDLATLREEWLRQLETLAADPPRLLSTPDLASLLYRWRDYTGGMDAPRRWIEKVTVEDRAFATVMSSLMSRGTSQGWGDRVAARHDTFRQQTVEEMIGLDVVAARLPLVDRALLDEEQRAALDVLDRHVAQWQAGVEAA